MTTNKYIFEYNNCCSPQWVSDNDYDSEAGPCSDKRKILINPPPQDGECMMCGRHVTELEAFVETVDSLFFDDISGAKLIRRYREFLPGYPVSNLECRDCIGRPGPLWAIHEENRLGRPLMQREYIDMRYKLELSHLEIHKEANQTGSQE